MNCVNITPDAAEDALVRLAQAVPADVVLGRPLVVTAGSDTTEGQFSVIITDLRPPTTWMVYADMTVRIVELPDGNGELCTFSDGQEVDRVIGTATE